MSETLYNSFSFIITISDSSLLYPSLELPDAGAVGGAVIGDSSAIEMQFFSLVGKTYIIRNDV